jgi:HK97 family phage major capsid protein
MNKFRLGALVALVAAVLIAPAAALAAPVGHLVHHVASFDFGSLAVTLAIVAGAPIRALQDKREQIVVQARAALDEITANTDESRSAELEQRHDNFMSDLDKLDAQIAREQRMARFETSVEETRGQRRPIVEGGEGRGAEGQGEGLTYRAAFHRYLASAGNEALLDADTRAVLRQGYQELPAEQRAQTTATNAAGGYTVPVELQARIVESMKYTGPMYDPGVTEEMVTTGGYSLPIPTIDDTAKSAAATTQGVTLLDDGSGDAVFGQKTIDAYSYATPWLRVSKELADDSMIAMEQFLGRLLGKRLGRIANAKLTVGSGTGEANGILTAASLGQTAASTTAFTADEILDLEHSVDPAYREQPGASFMFNDVVLKAIRKLKDGQGNYLWQAGNVQQGVPGTFNGRRYMVNQDMPSAFTTGSKLILFGDLKSYLVRKVGSPLIGAIQDKDFWPGFGIAGWIRFDGELLDTAAVKYLKLA